VTHFFLPISLLFLRKIKILFYYSHQFVVRGYILGFDNRCSLVTKFSIYNSSHLNYKKVHNILWTSFGFFFSSQGELHAFFSYTVDFVFNFNQMGLLNLFSFSFLWKIIIWVCCWLIQNNASCESVLHCCCYCLLFKIVFLHTWYGGDLYDF
jgi:hypothetical protein